MLRSENLFYFQAEDGIRDLVRSRGLGDVYKKQVIADAVERIEGQHRIATRQFHAEGAVAHREQFSGCLLYTSDAADELLSVDLGGRRIINKKIKNKRPQRFDFSRHNQLSLLHIYLSIHTPPSTCT